MSEQFAQPVVGRTIRVTTRFPESYYWATNKWRDNSYEGVVARPDRSVPEGSFKLLTPQDPAMPDRRITLRYVVAMEYADGSPVVQREVKDQVQVWQVSGSKGNVYTVTEDQGQRRCTCPGFTFRGACKHVR